MTDYRRCPKCNQPNDPATHACVSCGAELLRRCPNCGALRAWNVASCPNCQVNADDQALFTGLFQAPRTGTLRNRYVILETLASGPVSTVYRASDTRDAQRLYAIKELSTVSLFRADEKREAEQAISGDIARWSQASHEGIVPILDSFQDRDRYYVVTEYVYGWSLDQILNDPSVRISPDLVRNWGSQVCDFLAFLHGLAEPMHVPFLSPAHLIATPEGRVVLVGHGLSYRVRPVGFGPYGGIPGYAAPDLAQQSPDPRTDIFSLGRVLYALLLDRPLEKGLPRGLSLQQAVPGISTQLVRIIARAATSRRDQRYGSVAELRQALFDPEREAGLAVSGWYAASRTGAASPGRAGRASKTAEGGTMEDLGFARDPRYGRQESQATPAKAAPTQAAAVRMSVYPARIEIRDQAPHDLRRLVLTVRNAGQGDLEFRVVSQVSWIKAPARLVTLAPEKQARVVLTLNPASLPGDKVAEPRAILVESNAGRQWVPATVEIKTAPMLRPEPRILDFGQVPSDEGRTLALTIHNDGRQRLAGQIVSRVPWLKASPADFALAANESRAVSVSVLPERLPAGPQNVAEALMVDSNGGQARIGAEAWAPNPRMELASGVLDWGDTQEGAAIPLDVSVVNSGDGQLIGHARSLVPWLRVQPESWQVEAGQRTTLRVLADTAGLSDGPLHLPQAVRLQSNGGTAILAARLHIRAPRLELDSSTLDFGQVSLGGSASRELTIRNAGSAPMEAVINSAVDWISPAESVIRCEHGEARRVTVTAATGSVPAGGRIEISAALRVASGTDLLPVDVAIVVLQPMLEVEPGIVDFGYLEPTVPGSVELALHNTGTGDLAWYAQTDAEWLEIRPQSGRCEEGSASSITLTAYALGMEASADTATAILAISSDAGRLKIPLRVAKAAPRLEPDRTFVDLGTSRNREDVSASVRLFNRGLGLLRGTAISDRLWLVTGRTSLECDTGHSVELQLHTDMAEFADDLSEDRGIVTVETNGGTVEIDVRVQVVRTPALEEPEPVMLKRAEGSSAWQGRLILRNQGLATARVDITSTDRRLGVSRERVEVKPGKSVRIGVTWDDEAFLPDPNPALMVTCESDEWRISVLQQ